jgi:hypothetical protein
MTRKQANVDKNFERAPKNHILRSIDRMCRTNPETASTLEWWPVQSYDVGRRADYFWRSGFDVEKRKDNAPKVKP